MPKKDSVGMSWEKEHDLQVRLGRRDLFLRLIKHNDGTVLSCHAPSFHAPRFVVPRREQLVVGRISITSAGQENTNMKGGGYFAGSLHRGPPKRSTDDFKCELLYRPNTAWISVEPNQVRI